MKDYHVAITHITGHIKTVIAKCFVQLLKKKILWLVKNIMSVKNAFI